MLCLLLTSPPLRRDSHIARGAAPGRSAPVRRSTPSAASLSTGPGDRGECPPSGHCDRPTQQPETLSPPKHSPGTVLRAYDQGHNRDHRKGTTSIHVIIEKIKSDIEETMTVNKYHELFNDTKNAEGGYCLFLGLVLLCTLENLRRVTCFDPKHLGSKIFKQTKRPRVCFSSRSGGGGTRYQTGGFC